VSRARATVAESRRRFARGVVAENQTFKRGEINSFRSISKVLVYFFCSKRIRVISGIRKHLSNTVSGGVTHPHEPGFNSCLFRWDGKMETLSQLGGNSAAAAAGNNSETTLETTLQQPPPLEPPVQLQPAQLAMGQEQHKRSLEDGEEDGKRKSRRVQVKNKCEHDRWKDGRCKDCLCKHKVRRGDCKEGCSESTRKFCIHDRRKHGCKECFPASFCQHGKKKRRCLHRWTLAPCRLSWRLAPLSWRPALCCTDELTREGWFAAQVPRVQRT